MRVIFRYLGYLLVISAFFRLIPIGAALIYGESILLFILSILISLVAGALLIWRGKPVEDVAGLTLSQGLFLAAISFIILPCISAISFMPSFGNHFLNAYFESISGFTTTGLTLYSSLGELPKSLLLWRAETQWLGGIGIIMVFLFIFSRMHTHGYTRLEDIASQTKSTLALYQAQGFSLKLEGGFKKTISSIMMIYGGYTLMGIALLYFAGLSVFEAVSMTFTSLSTGGFAVTDHFYTGGWTLFVLTLLMILGSISFIAHNKLIHRKWKSFFFGFEKNVFLIFLVLATLITLTAYTDLRTVIFQLVSAFTTTGYSTAAIALLPQLFIVMIMIGMIVGGSVASTSGGIKVSRVYYLLRAIPWSVKKLSSPPDAVIPFQIHGETANEAKIATIGIFIFLYFCVLLIGTLAFMLFGYGFFDSSFQIISALGTVGLQTMDLALINPFLKIVLIIAMLLGRLEIFPFMIVLWSLFKNKSHS